MAEKRRLLLTRPRGRAERFAAELAREGWDCLIWPLTEIRPLPAPPPDIAGAQAALFTSTAGALAPATPAFRRLPVWCVGGATAAAAREAGHEQAFSADGDAAALAALVANRLSPGRGALVHVRGLDVAGDLAESLTAKGFEVRDHVAYEAVAVTAVPEAVDAAMLDGGIAAAAFFSPRAGAIFAGLAPDRWRAPLAGMTAFAISARAAASLAPAGFGRIVVAEAPTADALLAAICGAA